MISKKISQKMKKKRLVSDNATFSLNLSLFFLFN